MVIGVEYVVAAYGIWVCTFAVYILMTKRRMRIAGQTFEALKPVSYTHLTLPTTPYV